MDEIQIQEAELSAILNSFVYLDNYTDGIEGGRLGEIMELVGRSYESKGETPPIEYRQITEALAIHPEWSDVELLDRSSTNDTPQWTDDLIQAAAFRDTTGNYYVAYRGTGEGRWVDNGEGMADESTQMQLAAASYFDRLAPLYFTQAAVSGSRIIVTGHSKGGNEAQFVNMAAEYEYLISSCYSFDGQGFSQRAIDMFEDRYGNEYYGRQRERIYSICGENDYVHDLGIAIATEQNVLLLATVGDGLTKWHHISYMLGEEECGGYVAYSGLNLSYDENGELESGQQGKVGAFASALGRSMMELDEEERRGAAVAMMWAVDYLFMSEDKGQWQQLSDENPGLSDFIDLAAHGLPAIEEALGTKEGISLTAGMLESLIQDSYEKFGIAGVVGAAGISVLLAKPVLTVIGGIKSASAVTRAADFALSLMDKAVELAEEADSFLVNMYAYAEDLFAGVRISFRASSEGGRYVSTVSIRTDTGALRDRAVRLRMLSMRVEGISGDIRRYCKSGKSGVINRMFTAGVLEDCAHMLRICGSCLEQTADEMEYAESRIAGMMRRA